MKLVDLVAKLRMPTLSLSWATRKKAANYIEAAEIEQDRLRVLLEGRDKFIVDQGLWSAFVASLPAVSKGE